MQNKKDPRIHAGRTAGCAGLFGARNVTRTRDLLITNQLLYRLSYSSILLCLPQTVGTAKYSIPYFCRKSSPKPALRPQKLSKAPSGSAGACQTGS